MTGIEVAQNALVNITSYKYLYGAKGEVATSAMIEALIAAYPSHFNTDARKTAARAKAGYNCIDCSGYVCLVMGISSIGSWQLYETAPVKQELQYTNGKWKAGGAYIPYGAILWKPGHVGIYVGNQQTAEAVSEENDLQINNINGRGFTHCLLFNQGGHSISYSENLNDTALTLPATVTQPGYIPWIGKIINAEEVIPYLTSSGTVPATAFGTLYNGMLVSVIGLYGDYYKIQNTSGRYAYVNTYYVGNLNAPAYESGYINWIGQVKGADNHVNVRTAPRTSASLHSTFPQLPNGTRVKVIAETLGTEDLRLWYKVSLSDNSTAFIRADLVGPDVIQNYTPWLGQANSTTGIVNIRRFATVNSALSALHAPLSNGDVVTVYGETVGSDGYRWFSVSIDGVGVGYCRSDLITPAYENYYEEWYGYIQTGTGSGNLRQGPGTSYGLVEGSPYANGTLVHVEGEVNGADGYVWYKLTEFDGFHRGYIRSDLVQASMYYSHWPVFAMTVTGTLNIRSGPGTNYALSSICSSVPNGTGLTVVSQTVGTDLKIWYQVKINGEVAGYVRSDLVIAARPSAYTEWTATAASSTGVVNIRSGPSTNTAVISGYPQMNNGDHCTVYGQVEGTDGRIWYKVKVMNLYFGYVRADLLSHGTTITLTHDYAKWNGKLQSGTQNVNIRSDAGTNYSIVATLPNGTLVEVLGTKNGADSYVWYQVRTSGVAGYVRSDLVIHAGNTSGDHTYSEFSWSGRVVCEQAILVYRYPHINAEESQPARMYTYFHITGKVFDSHGETWYHVSADDMVLDPSEILYSGYVKESWVKVFPKNHNCEQDNEEHEYTYPDGAIYEECSKCGKHIFYQKPVKGITGIQCYGLSDNISDFFVNGTAITGIGITLTNFLGFLVSLEESLEDYIEDKASTYNITLSNGEKGVFALYLICDLARQNGYDTIMWSTVFLEIDNTIITWVNDKFHTNYQANDFAMEYYNSLSDDSTLKKQINLLLLVNTNFSPLVLLQYQSNNGVYSSTDYVKLHHLLAVIEGYYSPFTAPVPKFWFGWGGDLAHECGQVFESSNKVGCAMALVGQSSISRNLDPTYGDKQSVFRFEDIVSDVDAIGIVSYLHNNVSVNIYFLSNALFNYYQTYYKQRRFYFLADMGLNNQTPTVNQLTNTLITKLHESVLLNLLEVSVLSFWGNNADTETIETTCRVFAKYILSEEADFR